MAEFTTFPKRFKVKDNITDRSSLHLLVNDVIVPPYSCNTGDYLQECAGAGDNSCGKGLACVTTWNIHQDIDISADAKPEKFLVLADHFNPAALSVLSRIRIELVQVTD